MLSLSQRMAAAASCVFLFAAGPLAAQTTSPPCSARRFPRRPTRSVRNSATGLSADDATSDRFFVPSAKDGPPHVRPAGVHHGAAGRARIENGPPTWACAPIPTKGELLFLSPHHPPPGAGLRPPDQRNRTRLRTQHGSSLHRSRIRRTALTSSRRSWKRKSSTPCCCSRRRACTG